MTNCFVDGKYIKKTQAQLLQLQSLWQSYCPKE